MPTLKSVNALSDDDFVSLLACIIEHSDWVAQSVLQLRPFNSVAELHRAMVDVVKRKGEKIWEEILCLHPELSGKEAQEGSLTQYSTQEQAGIGLDRLLAEHFNHMKKFNRAYREQFGFPFVVCVRLLPSLSALFAEQERRIARSRDEELRAGIEEVFKIAQCRLTSLISE